MLTSYYKVLNIAAIVMISGKTRLLLLFNSQQTLVPPNLRSVWAPSVEGLLQTHAQDARLKMPFRRKQTQIAH